MLETGREGEI
jgi:hypothetical protein